MAEMLKIQEEIKSQVEAKKAEAERLAKEKAEEEQKMQDIFSIKESLENNLTSHLSSEKALKEEKLALEAKLAEMLKIQEEIKSQVEAKKAEAERLAKEKAEEEQKMQDIFSIKESLENNLTSHLSSEKALKEEKLALESKLAEMLKVQEEEKAKAERLAKEKADAEAKAKAEAENKIAEKKLSDVFALTHVAFKFNSMDLTDNSKKLLDRAANTIKKYPQFTYIIKGYTDNRGRAEYNLKLSGQRANKVREYLISQGVDAGLLTSKGFGEENPIASNDTAEGRKKNRRVVFEIVK
ncbi:OmpA domain protein [hydrothermal vent metagenome]|uniref:OmpA domain protein n=1 Tax=hydrothermal vent metagenome TaxID=652676 RepID=A0A1W1BKE9_9ZZZZ